jgi:hypothetical protein
MQRDPSVSGRLGIRERVRAGRRLTSHPVATTPGGVDGELPPLAGDVGLRPDALLELVRRDAARLKAALDEVLQPLDHALGLRMRASQKCQPTRSCPQNAANASVGRPSWACSPA